MPRLGVSSRFLKRFAIFCVGAVVLSCGYLAFLSVSGNFHTVVPNEVYRSAQLNADDIPRIQAKYHIRTILNLRGDNTGTLWYDDEIRASRVANVEHVNFRMSAAKQLKQDEVLALIDVMRKAPKPLLIHCKAGADRTGLASALYIAAISKGGEEAAEEQLWPIYGHLPF